MEKLSVGIPMKVIHHVVENIKWTLHTHFFRLKTYLRKTALVVTV